VRVCLSVSMSASIFLKLQVQTSPNFLRMLLVAVALFCSDGVLILPVLRMTSHFPVICSMTLCREMLTLLLRDIGCVMS